jgi:hypothetical protein
MKTVTAKTGNGLFQNKKGVPIQDRNAIVQLYYMQTNLKVSDELLIAKRGLNVAGALSNARSAMHAKQRDTS